MPDKSASVAQQRMLGMAWAARSGKLDTSKLDPEFRKKIDKIANSDTFSDATLSKMAHTKHKSKETRKKLPYLIGKGSAEKPEKKFLKKKRVYDAYIPTFEEYLTEMEMSLNPGMNVMGMVAVSMPGNPGTTTDFHNQEVGSGDMPAGRKKDDDEDEEEEKRRIKKELNARDVLTFKTFEQFINGQ